MEEKKLTDEEIIKAIDKCFAIPMKCEDGCPYFNKNGRNFCVEDKKFYHDLKDLIHRLQEERENMQAEILRFEDMKFTQEHCDLYSENETLKQWLKRLNADLENEKNWGKIQTKQAVKDTAKEIYELLEKWVWKLKNEKGGLGNFRFAVETVMQEIKEKYLLEVANFKLVELKKGERK